MTRLRPYFAAMKRHPVVMVAGASAVVLFLAALLLPTWALIAILVLAFLAVIGSGGRRVVAETATAVLPTAFVFGALAIGIAALASTASGPHPAATASVAASPSPSMYGPIDMSTRCVDDKANLTANHPVAGMCDSPFEYDQSACDAYPAGTVLLHVGRAVTYRPSGYWTNGVWYCVEPTGTKVQL